MKNQKVLLVPFLLFSLQGSYADEAATRLDEVLVSAEQVSNPEPANTFGTVASSVPFAPSVDLQSRNIPEAQGDLAIRGGTFETSGLSFGALSLVDPQTGHYLLELPVDPKMLTSPTVQTGADQAINGFNATSGSLKYDFAPIKDSQGTVRAGIGSRETRVGSVYVGGTHSFSGNTFGADLTLGDSTSQGTRTNGDFNSHRIAGRIQFRTDDSQTDFLVGYDRKYFSWPNLYALQELHDLVGSSGIEAERLGTSFFMLNHKMRIGERSSFEVAAANRRHTDDYDFDRFNPGLFNPYRHTTRSTTVGGRADIGITEDIGVELAAQSVADDIDSTALTAGNFNSRRYYKLSAAPTYRTELSPGYVLKLKGGASLDNTNQDGSRVSPLSRVSLIKSHSRGGENEYYVDVSQTSQVSGYTALNSNASAGLFRGNPNLGRSVSTNYELGTEVRRAGWRAKTAAFYRYDRNLTDWTYQSSVKPFASRSAESVDIGVYGFELSGAYQFGRSKVEAGYMYLDKNSNYANPLVDASFYALNYAKHLWMMRTDTTLAEGIRWVNSLEIRTQIPNVLRQSSGDTFALANSQAHFAIPGVPGAEVVAIIDNPWLENFQEVPGVLGKGRLGMVEVRFGF